MPTPELLIRSVRLDLVASTLRHLEAELQGGQALGELLGAEVPPGWPPGEYDRQAIEFLRGRLVEGGDAAAGWFGWYGIRRGAADRRPALVAAAGYFGPPADGMVEIGYSVIPAARGNGYATEMVMVLALRALRSPGVGRVIAHTAEANPASARVLGKCGFARIGPGAEPGTVRYERVVGRGLPP